MTTRAQIVATARTFVRTKFQHQGRLPGVVLDCIGTAYLAGVQAGLALPPCPFDYEPMALDDSLVERLDSFLERVAPGGEKLADVACFRVPRDGYAQHLGILSGTDRMVHAWSSIGCVAEEPIAAKWGKRLIGWWRYPGLEDA